MTAAVTAAVVAATGDKNAAVTEAAAAVVTAATGDENDAVTAAVMATGDENDAVAAAAAAAVVVAAVPVVAATGDATDVVTTASSDDDVPVAAPPRRGQVADDPVPALVRVLAGNSVTGATILACLNTVDANALRELHPAVAGAVADVPWCDTETAVVDPVRWRAGLPAATGARLAPTAEWEWITNEPAVAALAGVTRLDLHDCSEYVTDELLLRLPVSLRALNVAACRRLTPSASFTHLPVLASLDCSWTEVVNERTDGLPPSLVKLAISGTQIRGSLAHLTRLRVLRAASSALDGVTLASLPPGLVELHAVECNYLTPAASFAHLPALQTLDVTDCSIGDAALACMSPSLVSLTLSGCRELTCVATLPHLPSLRRLDVSWTYLGDALVRSLPPGLEELRLMHCSEVTAAATLDHVPALRLLYSIGTHLAPATLVACRTRGCTAPAPVTLGEHQMDLVTALTVLADGRLAVGNSLGGVQLWDVAVRGAAVAAAATAALTASDRVQASAALPGGRRLAVGTRAFGTLGGGGIAMWDVVSAPPVRCVFIDCGSSCVWSLAVLADGRLAAGCADGAVRIVNVDAGVVAAVLEGHSGNVVALAVMPGGRLASGSEDTSVRVWDVGARACVAMLVGHVGGINALAVLADGRLVSGSVDGTVRLWDVVGVGTCVGMLSPRSETGAVWSLAALPDGRLATGTEDGGIWLWDTSSAAATAAAGSSRAAGAVSIAALGRAVGGVRGLVVLPDGRLASAHTFSSEVHLWEVPPPVV